MARSRLTPEFIRQLCDRIKGGAYEHVAAESLGVSAAELDQWLERGRRPRAGRRYRELYRAVLQARGHARLMAETELRRDQPRYWLLHGPGKETSDRPGWTATAKPKGKKETAELPTEVLELLAELYAALAPYPEARAAAAEVLARRGLSPDPGGRDALPLSSRSAAPASRQTAPGAGH